MGIPSYFSYIIKNHSNIIRNHYYYKKISPTHFHSLYMDCNSIIYDTFHQLSKSEEYANATTNTEQFERALIKGIIEKIRQHISSIGPSNVVYIAFDGVAPFAKMSQQRTRRYKTAFQNSVDFSRDPTVPKVVNTDATSYLVEKQWNTVSITAGTQFMEKMSKIITEDFKKNPVVAKTTIVSTSMDAGEGEHKMFEYMRHNALQSENIAVYGLDADLIMLSLFHTFACQNIYIFREAPDFSEKLLPKNIKIKPNDLLFVNSRKLANCIAAEATGFTTVVSGQFRNRVNDYIFMCFFMGNDFLPHFPALNIRNGAIDMCMDVYRQHIGIHQEREFISMKNATIAWKWVKLFVGELAKLERNSIANSIEFRKKIRVQEKSVSNMDDRQFLFENAPILYSASESYIAPEIDGWETRYYRVAFHQENPTKEFIKGVCMNYLEGLEWVFRYYTEGCVDWRWKYAYHYPPLLSDLVQYIPDFETEFFDNVAEDRMKPHHPYIQLAYVVPAWNAALMPSPVQKVMRENRQYYPRIDELKFDWLFCRYFWESHVNLPEIPIEKIEYILK